MVTDLAVFDERIRSHGRGDQTERDEPPGETLPPEKEIFCRLLPASEVDPIKQNEAKVSDHNSVIEVGPTNHADILQNRLGPAGVFLGRCNLHAAVLQVPLQNGIKHQHPEADQQVHQFTT